MSFTGKCFRHCDKPTSMKPIIREASKVVATYTCPDGFVSQVVYFSERPDLDWFSKMMATQVGEEHYTTDDVRTASRQGCELGNDARSELEHHLGRDGKVVEVYWTRYPRTDEQKIRGISLCTGDASRAGCLKIFAHDVSKDEKVCPACG